MSIEKYIQDLLYKHSCIVVPNFGTFFAHSSPAQHKSGAKTLTPPSKVVSFNDELLQDDGLLVSRLSRTENIDSDNSLIEVHTATNTWKEQLKDGNALFLEGLGILKPHNDKVVFNADTEQNYLLSSFGLAPAKAVPVDRGFIKPEQSDKIRFAPPVEKKLSLVGPEEIEEEDSTLLPWLKYASIILLFISVILTAYYFFNQDAKNKELVVKTTNEEVASHIQEAVIYKNTPLALPPLEIKVEKKFHVVAGAFRIKTNAEKKIADLKQNGYDDAHYIGANKYELHQVSYATFDNNSDALALLNEIHDEGFSDAWILEE